VWPIRKDVSELLQFGGFKVKVKVKVKVASDELNTRLYYLPIAAAECTLEGQLCSALSATELPPRAA
jgi:hypothetical protein